MGCKATTKKGDPCKNAAIDGKGVCIAHLSSEDKQALGFGGAQEKGGREKKPRLIDVLRAEVEARMDEVTAPFWEGLHSDDMDTRQKSAKELLDRSYGKPTQSTEISGPQGDPIELVKLPTDKDWNTAVANVLKQSGALDADSDQDK